MWGDTECNFGSEAVTGFHRDKAHFDQERVESDVGWVSERDVGGERELRPHSSSGSRYEQLSFAGYP